MLLAGTRTQNFLVQKLALSQRDRFIILLHLGYNKHIVISCEYSEFGTLFWKQEDIAPHYR